MYFFFFKQKTAYELRISDWSSDVCSSDLTVEMTEAAFELGLEQDMAFEVVPGLWLVGVNGWYSVSDEPYWRSYMNDSRLIGISANHANALALRDAAFVDRLLSENSGKALCVTHTAPTTAYLATRFDGKFTNTWYLHPTIRRRRKGSKT